MSCECWISAWSTGFEWRATVEWLILTKKAVKVKENVTADEMLNLESVNLYVTRTKCLRPLDFEFFQFFPLTNDNISMTILEKFIFSHAFPFVKKFQMYFRTYVYHLLKDSSAWGPINAQTSMGWRSGAHTGEGPICCMMHHAARIIFTYRNLQQ